MTIQLIENSIKDAEVILEGTFDTDAALEADKILMSIADDYEKVTINFSSLRYITSAGLRIILRMNQRLEQKDGEFALIHVNKAAMDVLEMVGFASVMNIQTDGT